jgi:hypothetical protein
MGKLKLTLKPEYLPLSKKEIKEQTKFGNPLALNTREVLPLPLGEIQADLQSAETKIKKLYIDDGFLVVKFDGKEPNYSTPTMKKYLQK